MRISEFIRTNIDLILEAWTTFAKETLSGRDLSLADLRDHAAGILNTIVVDLDQTQSLLEQVKKSKGLAPRTLLPTEAELHGSARVASGFTINDAMAEFRSLRASVLLLWGNSSYGAACSDDVNRFNEAIDQALAESLARFSDQKFYLTRFFDAILSASPDLNLIFHDDGSLIYANKAFADLYALELDEVTNRNLFSLCAISEKPLRQYITTIIATGTPDRVEMPYISVTGADSIFEWLLIPILDDAGKVEAIAAVARDITARKEAEGRNLHSANYDSLTNLPNRLLLLDRLDHEAKRAERNKLSLALMFIDLDKFKEVNDSLGHSSGDELLRVAARRIRSCVRDMDTVARLGGDEFIVLFADVRKISQVEICAQHILEQLTTPFVLLGSEAQISASIGIALFPQDAQEPEELINSADKAMYVAKATGRNRYSLFNADMRDAGQTRPS